MRLRDVVNRLKAECPGFQHIGHALTSSAQYDYPAAFVAPVKVTAQPSGLLGSHRQMTTRTVGVFVVLDRKQDDAPDAGNDDLLDDLCADLRAALMGWQAPGADMPFDYAGGELSQMRDLVGWREDFSVTTELRMP